MRKHLQKILFPLLILFFAFSFPGNPPRGWYVQVLPRTDLLITDINFVDSLKGWAVAVKYPSQDSGFILHTINGGDNWSIQFDTIVYLNVIQFLDANTGFAAGGTGRAKFYKTTNSGTNWQSSTPFGSGIYAILDLAFVNSDTGWICSDDGFGGGIYKTTNGGVNWTKQLGASAKPTKLFFLNSVTGWAVNKDPNGKLFRTTNAGINWSLQYALPEQSNFGDVYFFNENTGIITSGTNLRTTNGGFNWMPTNETGGYLSFANDSIGWAGNNFNQIMKTTNGGVTWGRQSSPSFNNLCVSAKGTNKAWAGGTGIVHTIDGGGPVTKITIISTVIPEKYFLHQNYPNPFNPSTIINYQLTINSLVTLKVYDSRGKEIATLVNEKQNAGTYSADFNAAEYNISSGIYFYSLSVNGSLIDTKKMILIK